MTIPTLIDFENARRTASDLNRQRSCFLKISDTQPFLGNIPSQFKMTVSCTKAAKKRGQYAKALGEFTDNNWFAVLLEQPTSYYGKEATEMIFTMNPIFKTHIEQNIDQYRYTLFMRKIQSWDKGFNNLKSNQILTNYLGWDLSGRVETIIKKHFYDRLSECGSFASASIWLFQNSNAVLEPRSDRSPLPSCYTEVLRSHLKVAQNLFCSVFGSPNVPRVQSLEDVILGHIQ